MRILFREDTHQYYIENSDKVFDTSMSKVIKSVEPKKDFDKIAEEFVNSKNNKEGWKTKEEVLAAWDKKRDKTANRGTIYHSIREKEDKERGAFYHDKTELGFDIGFDIEKLKNLAPGVYTELIIPNFNTWVIGKSDRVEIFEDRGFYISDYKGFSLDTPIATTKGWSFIGDIKIGDEIFDRYGNPTKVTKVSDIHYNPCYKIMFDTGESLICDEDHKWFIDCVKKNSVVIIEKELTTKEIISLLEDSTHILRIPTQKINLPDVELPIDPYLLGIFLGDGNRANGSISQMNPKVWEEIEKRGYSLSVDRFNKTSSCPIRTVYGFTKALSNLNLIKNKHIPDIYLRSSFNQRLDLLRGFMDADGYFHNKRKRFVMNTTQEWQYKDLAQLLSSLGIKPTIIPYKASGFGKTNVDAYAITFCTELNPFLVRNENCIKEMEGKSFMKSKNRYITKIERVDTVPTICLGVESESQSYLIGKGFITTHNCIEDLQVVPKKWYRKELGYSEYEYLLPPCQHLHNTKFNLCQLQLSGYSLFLEQLGYKFKGGHLEQILFDDNDEVKDKIIHPIKYLKKEAESILKAYRSKQVLR